MRLLLIGFGAVGQGLANILREQAEELRDREAFEALIVGVATRSRGTLYHRDGLSLDTLLDALSIGRHIAQPAPIPGCTQSSYEGEGFRMRAERVNKVHNDL